MRETKPLSRPNDVSRDRSDSATYDKLGAGDANDNVCVNDASSPVNGNGNMDDDDVDSGVDKVSREA